MPEESFWSLTALSGYCLLKASEPLCMFPLFPLHCTALPSFPDDIFCPLRAGSALPPPSLWLHPPDIHSCPLPRARPDGCDSDSDSWPAHSPQALSQGDLTGCLACNTGHKQFPTRHLQSQPLSRLRSSCFLARPLWLRGAAPPTIQSRLPSGVPLCAPSSPRTEKTQSSLLLCQSCQSVLTTLVP